MPLGKNSIKRAANNGYSNVKTAAPDMENSEVVEVKTEVKPTPKKASKKAPVKTATKTVVPEVKPVEKPVAKKTPVKKSAKKTETVEGFKRVSFGEEMPYYLL
jgi:hypothetical protein